MPPRSAFITLAVGVVVLLAAGGVVASRVVKTQALTPAGVLAEYATAIETGDLSTADAVTRQSPTARPPVGGQALANPTDRISSVTTKIISSTADSATGSVSYEIAGSRHTATVTLGTGPAQFGLLPDWQVTTPLTVVIAVKVPAAGTATVNGVETPLTSDLGLTVYPGRYDIGLAADNTWFTSNTVSVIASGPNTNASPTIAPTQALEDEALVQVKKAIDACVATAVPTPAGCPFSEPALGTLADFSWKLDRYPTLSFLDPTHVFLQGGAVTANFVLSYSYIRNKPEVDPIAIKGTGAVTFAGTSVAVALIPG